MAKIVLILGDQLSLNNPALAHFNPICDRLLMVEVQEAVTQVWSHKARIVFFLSAMRHFAQVLRAHFGDAALLYLDISQGFTSFDQAIRFAMTRYACQQLVCQHPGDRYVKHQIESLCVEQGYALTWTEDAHFYCRYDEFSQWAQGKKQLRMEYFYRWMRQRTGILMQESQPEGGEWNYDTDNRQPMPKQGLGWLSAPVSFDSDEITQSVLSQVAELFPNHPGSLDKFAWPVTRDQALDALSDFVHFRLANFGAFQDAMGIDEPFLYHSLLSASLNVQLLHPKEVVDAALQAYASGDAPLNSVEGFVRQILGWREFVRGCYWWFADDWDQANAWQHHRSLPDFYWTGKTNMVCMQQALQQTLDYGYAHHIQRLMVLGLYATLAEVTPSQVSDWFHAIYVDAVDWVQRPNVLGMALCATGGSMTSKPYIASGAYIDKMSNYCSRCHYQPKEKLGVKACPFTLLYWRFILRHEAVLSSNPRTKLMVTHVAKLSAEQRESILSASDRWLTHHGRPV